MSEFSEDFELELQTYTHYGLKVLEIEGEEFAVAENEEEAIDAVTKHLRETLHYCSPTFLQAHIKIDLDIEVIQAIQNARNEEAANEAIYNLVDDFEYLVGDAISCDGIGQFLADYDSHEKYYNDLFPDDEDLYAKFNELTGYDKAALFYRIN